MSTLESAANPGLTLYKEVQRQMLVALAADEWLPGEAIPAEKRLCERFGVSIGTLRKAIDELVNEGILIRHQGRGTFVSTHNRDQHLFRFFNVVRRDGNKTYPSVSMVSFVKARAEKSVAEKLGISSNAKVFQLTNLLSLNDEIVLVDEISLPEARFAGLTEWQLRNRTSTLYHLYQVDFGINVIRIEERLRASLALAPHAQLLGIEAGSPLLEIHRLAFSYHDQPVERRVSYVNTAAYEYLSMAAP